MKLWLGAWNLEGLKAALEAGRRIGRDRLVADS